MKRLLFVLLIALLVGGLIMRQMTDKHRVMKVAFGNPWVTIHPGLQHTLVGDLVLSNQFESLVGMNEFGVSVPLGAKSWEMSEDYKTLTFHIDTQRTFSNGKKLSAKDFKRSWETALMLEPKSKNSSLLDVMYKIQGFADFEKSKTLSGIEAFDDATLRVRFDSPFRMALTHLQGNRFSAFIEEGDKFFGTGKYVIEEQGDHSLRFTPNPHDPEAKDLSPVEVSVVSTSDSIERLLDGSIDVFAYGRGSVVPLDLKEKKNLSVVIGQEALHETLIANLLPGRFFHDKNHRLALQYLVYQAQKSNPKRLGNPDYSSVDAQVFMPFQTGRLEAAVVDKLIEEGKKYFPELVAQSQKHPLLVFTSEGDEWLLAFLKENGIAVAPESKKITAQERISIIYKTYEPDLIVAAFGVASGDPDGIYHRLGKSGAIMTPMSYSEEISNLLEEGRKRLRQDELDPFYQKINRRVLAEVPFIHMGYSKAVAIYRNDRVEHDSKLLKRNEGHIHGFSLR